MRYGFIYLLCVLVLLMLALRFFLPFFIYLFPIFAVLWIIKILFRSRRQKNQTSNEERTYYESTYQNNQTSDPDIIDVDYKVVDEQEQDDTH